MNGTYGTWCDQAGGWLKEWDKAFERENRKGGRWGVQTLRPNKGRLSARNREDRARKVRIKSGGGGGGGMNTQAKLKRMRECKRERRPG